MWGRSVRGCGRDTRSCGEAAVGGWKAGRGPGPTRRSAWPSTDVSTEGPGRTRPRASFHVCPPAGCAASDPHSRLGDAHRRAGADSVGGGAAPRKGRPLRAAPRRDNQTRLRHRLVSPGDSAAPRDPQPWLRSATRAPPPAATPPGTPPGPGVRWPLPARVCSPASRSPVGHFQRVLLPLLAVLLLPGDDR